MDALQVERIVDGTWFCTHVDESGEPALPTRLRLDDTCEWPNTSHPRRWIECPECGTLWRAWPPLGAAKPSAEWNVPEGRAVVCRYRRAPLLDIDRIIDLVKSELPAIRVVQNFGVWPADDEGLWVFRLPNVDTDIQLESSTGMCPFLVEVCRMRIAADGVRASSAEEAARTVVEYFRHEVENDGSIQRGL